MEELENLIRNYLLNKTLEDLELYTINNPYLAPDPDRTWIVNGGIAIKIGKEDFSFGWDSEKEFFNISNGPINSLTRDLETEYLDAKQADQLGLLVGNSISRIDFKWNFYQELDENMEISEEKKYIPFEMLIAFDNGSDLQISAVDFAFDGTTISDFIYDSQRQLLISVNNPMTITLEDSEPD